MKFHDFESKMRKAAFTYGEAQIVAHADSPASLRLNLHRWTRKGYLTRIRREVYAFPDRLCPLSEQIAILYPPAYVSLESALNLQGILPDVPFEITLVTPRPTRLFQTVWGRFRFHKIQRHLFFGFDSRTLLAEPEKALLDYFYFRGPSFVDHPSFWKEARLQNLNSVRWKKGDATAQQYRVPRVEKLWKGLKHYAKTHRTD